MDQAPSENLTNPGLHILNPSPCPAQATIFAFGLGRSGTTMLARVMQDLGVFMGETVSPQFLEDADILAAVKSGDLEAFERICRVRDADHDRWGFKCPAARGDVSGLAARMRNPRAIVVFRDIVAIALRNSMEIDIATVKALRKSAKSNVLLLKQVTRNAIPVLLISYEKALQFPEQMVLAIADHCGLEVSSGLVAKIAAEAVSNGDPRYLTDQA
ncbi:hypothetical protein ATO6_22675 [Oceanicola sp. 22II-s10i]|uniref:hypothetical protein n=1 Tax=Oceanicola sp. 22II-s10i TaxID=1317116 RepID=UPI000B52825E|nr:hypothetical protein [Oceanicola sp. 22II-s10i]OWU82251.1 hypothetical protein ATO6_22675 [Oceanicola sp. 22II-s10i]